MEAADPTPSDMILANKANWDARTPIHLDSDFYDLPGVRAGSDGLADFELAALAALGARDGVHLQCHLGTDTISLGRTGIRMTGLDLSAEAVRAAGTLAADCALDIDYHQADVYDAVDVLGRDRFDLVYTGKGALCWLPDLPRWAATVAGLLRPGGSLYLVEFHPIMTSAAEDQPELADGVLHLARDYSSRAATASDAGWTYTDGPRLACARLSYEWSHGLGDVITAVAGAGMVISGLAEYPVCPWPRYPDMVRDGRSGWWRLPDRAPQIPLIYALRAVRPS